MSTDEASTVAYEGSPLTLPLESRGPRTPALAGTPVESVQVLHRDAGGRSGVWECTPGRFESARIGDTELMYFLAGSATITSADGTVYDIHPGVTLVAPDGWRGTWDIRETVRKVYTIWNVPTPTTDPNGEPS